MEFLIYGFYNSQKLLHFKSPSYFKSLRSVYKPHFVSELRRFTPERLHPCRIVSAIIYLCSLPETQKERAAPLSLLDLAPDGGCLAAHIAVNAGGLLHHLFTLTVVPRKAHFGYLFLWPDPTDCSIPGFPRRRALWSTDFPRFSRKLNRDHPTGLRWLHHTTESRGRQHK